ncbi:MAG: 6-phosphogluconolactonase [Stagnimonas sp.]|nr:6-phosphogluconolactonase [Stagnimonas sp.]
MAASRVPTRWISVADDEALAAAACERILRAAGKAIEARGQFLLVLTGGNTPKQVYVRMAKAQADWSRWHFYFGDERCLPVADAERNSRMVCEVWLDRVPVPREQIHPVPAEAGALAAASRYAERLRELGDFDLVLMGLGEDGHTASLFPGHDWGESATAPDVLAVFDSPKPPPERVSLSAARLGRTREMLFLVAGEGKQRAVAEWRRGALLPAAAVSPPAGVDVLVTPPLPNVSRRAS